MNVREFITQEEFDEAPDDPSMAFAVLVGHAQRRLAERVARLEDSNQDYAYDDAHHSFMNVALGLAKAYKIEPFASLEVPLKKGFDFEAYRQFESDLDHYVTQILVDGSLRRKRDSVVLPPKVKDTIRGYIHGLRGAIDQAQVSDAKRAALHKKLTAFEIELDKSRLNLLAVTMVVLAIAAVPGSLWASYEVVTKLTNSLLHTVGEAKAVDDENRQLPPIEAPAALLPPRRHEDERSPQDEGSTGSLAEELDDEIPF